MKSGTDRLRGFFGDEGGQTLPLIAVSMTMVLGMAAFAIDIGRGVYTQRELQAGTDAAALAAARAMPTAATLAAITGSNGVVVQYSSASGGANARASLPGVTVTSKLECLNTLKTEGMACVGIVPYNAVQVTQTTTISTFFGAVIGIKTMPITTTATASVRGGAPRPSTIAVVLDTTLSMNIYDSDCKMTALQCELNGFQTLLQNLNPCGLYQANCNPSNEVATNAFDSVAIFTFPNVSVGTAWIDSGCTSAIPASVNTSQYPNAVDVVGASNNVNYGMGTMLGGPSTPWPYLPTALPWSFPTPGAVYAGLSAASTSPTYQITPFLSDYRTSDTAATLNQSSELVKAAGGVASCGSMAPPNWEGDYETYYAGAIYAAQSALAAARAANPSTETVMIILSDGDSNAWQSGGIVSGSTGYASMSGAPTPAGNYLTATGNGTYPSWVGECEQAIVAAGAATSAGTLVYSVGYGSGPSGCGTDVSPALTPCQTMAGMASAPQYFYSDYNQNGVVGTCVSGQPATSLNGIFQAIAADLTEARLIPNNTT